MGYLGQLVFVVGWFAAAGALSMLRAPRAWAGRARSEA